MMKLSKQPDERFINPPFSLKRSSVLTGYRSNTLFLFAKMAKFFILARS